MQSLRERVLRWGFSPEECHDTGGTREGCSVRGKVWKIFLGVGAMDAAAYLGLVRRGRSPLFEQITTDVKRTFKSDAHFREVGGPLLG